MSSWSVEVPNSIDPGLWIWVTRSGGTIFSRRSRCYLIDVYSNRQGRGRVLASWKCERQYDPGVELWSQIRSDTETIAVGPTTFEEKRES